jgi:hypothetical protein
VKYASCRVSGKERDETAYVREGAHKVLGNYSPARRADHDASFDPAALVN